MHPARLWAGLVAAFAMSVVACVRHEPMTGAALSRSLDRVALQASERVQARDTTEALRLLAHAVDGTSGTPERDLLGGHIMARASETSLLAELAALRAVSGDTASARAAMERLLFEGAGEDLLDSLERSPRYAALGAMPPAAAWRDQLVALRRWRRDSAFATPYRDTLSVEERAAGVSLVWAEARYSFVGLSGAGTANWDSVYRATLARVTQPMDTWGYYQELERMLATLGDNHTGVTELPAPLRKHRTGVPLDARRVDGRVFITSVRSPSLAALGVRVGQEVVTIDGLTPDAHVAQRVPPQLGYSTPQARDAMTYGWQMWLGELGSTFVLRLRDADGAVHDVTLHRGGWSDAVAIPTVEARRLEGGIGYLALNSFGDPRASALIDSAMKALGDIRGLIVDTRRNSGGSQDAGWHLLAQFMTTPYVQDRQFSNAYVGIWRAWGGSTIRVPMPERVVNPDPAVHRTYPLFWLIGPRTASAAEGVAALAEQTGVATTMGEPTFGSTGQPLQIPLPGGGRARIRVEEERYNDGRIYTRRGIMPQLLVVVTPDGLRAGRDEVLERAVQLMREKIGAR